MITKKLVEERAKNLRGDPTTFTMTTKDEYRYQAWKELRDEQQYNEWKHQQEQSTTCAYCKGASHV